MNRRNVLVFTFCFILVFSPFVLPIHTFAKKDYTPLSVHLTWQHDPKTTMTISWRTVDATESIVQYGKDDSFGSEEAGVFAIWHHVELTDLTPDTIYHYRVGNGETWSEHYSFKTGTIGKHTRFIAWGDSRHFRDVRRSVVDAVKNINFDLSIFTGDFVDAGRYASQWYEGLADFAPVIRNIPFMSILGNHEDNHSNYYEFFALPEKEEYYSFNYGAIHFSMLHSCIPDYGGTFDEEIDWLINDLEIHENYDWKVVAMHRPAFSSSQRNAQGDYDDLKSLFVPIFEQYGVDLVFSGHDHFYERLHKNNITYMITAGAGAPLYSYLPFYKVPESVFGVSKNHAVFIEVYENQLNLKAFDINQTIFDTFTINRITKPDLQVTNLPTTHTHLVNESKDITISISNMGEENITLETKATIQISNGSSWEINIPFLNINESVNFTYKWVAPGLGAYNWKITLDTEDLIDEVVEENNIFELNFIAIEETIEKTSFILPDLWGFLVVLSALMITVSIIKKRKK